MPNLARKRQPPTAGGATNTAKFVPPGTAGDLWSRTACKILSFGRMRTERHTSQSAWWTARKEHHRLGMPPASAFRFDDTLYGQRNVGLAATRKHAAGEDDEESIENQACDRYTVVLWHPVRVLGRDRDYRRGHDYRHDNRRSATRLTGPADIRGSIVVDECQPGLAAKRDASKIVSTAWLR